MAEYTVWGDADPPFALHDDGNPFIMLGDTFYQYGGSPGRLFVVGGRVYCPAVTLPPQVIIKAWYGETGVRNSQHNLDTEPIREETVDTVSGGWAEARWDPFEFPADGFRVMIGYQFTGGADPGWSDSCYVHASRDSLGWDANAITVDPPKFAHSENNSISEEFGPVVGSYYRIGTDPVSLGSNASYGSDIIVSDGDPTPPSGEPFGYYKTESGLIEVSGSVKTSSGLIPVERY